MSDAPLRVVIAPTTHWDREWYLPLEAFRARLVEVLDEVLDHLDVDADYRFTLDGQAVILEDYLATRPEAAPKIAQHARSGRLRIGPWYVLADEFLVSPESLIRNLLVGRAACLPFAEPMPVLYTPDSFGHVSSLPLLARGFGMAAILFERGVGDEGERLGTEFRWSAPGGEHETVAHHMIATYSAAAALGHTDWSMPNDADDDLAAAHLRAILRGGGHTDLDGLPTWFRASLERVEGGLERHARVRTLLLMNGSDHLAAQTGLAHVLERIAPRFPRATFEIGDPIPFAEALVKAAPDLEGYEGEFRSGRYHHILSGVLSSRLWLKRRNHELQNRLERYIEPLDALAWTRDGRDGRPLERLAWRILLRNHPHDSICGCSVDEVHEEMEGRFTKVAQIADAAVERSLATSPDATSIAVFNPSPFPRAEEVATTVTLPGGWAVPVHVRDEEGRPIATSIVQVEERDPVHEPVRVELRFRAEVPGVAVRRFALAPGENPAPTPDEAVQDELRNDLFTVRAHRDGTLELRDLSGRELGRTRLAFEDEGEAGDSYDHSSIPDDVPICSGSFDVRATTREGRTALFLETTMEIPEHLSADRRSRAGSTHLSCAVRLELHPHEPFVRLFVRIDNRARDHRVRLRVATDVRTDHVRTEGHFDVIERPLRPPERPTWFQPPAPTVPQRRYAIVHDGSRGLALLNRGLPELEPAPGADGAELAVTLLRAFGWLSRDDLVSRPQGAGPALRTPGGQGIDVHESELALLPLGTGDPVAAAARAAERFDLPLLALQSEAPSTDGVELDDGLALSAFKIAEDGQALVVRVHNPAAHHVAGDVTIPPGFTARLARLDETPLDPLPSVGGRVRLDLAPRDVLTLRLEKEAGRGA